ncbi:MAG TPA: TolC family protein, partial [Pirellulales bacterium]
VQFFVPFAEGLFNPLALRQQTAVMRYEASATSNSVLLDTTSAYFDLLAAETQVEAFHLSRGNLQQVVDTCSAYARTGQGRQGDANRAAAEGYLVLLDLQGAEETLAVSSAALARLLHLDPSTRLKTPGGPLRTFNIVDIDRPLGDLIQVAVRYRPELRARDMAIAESRTRVRQEQKRPLLPLVTAGYSVGGFGGTGNFPNGAASAAPFTALYDRADFDAMAVWTLQNMGAGNISLVNRRRAQVDQSIYDRVRVVNLVRREVTEGYGYALGERNQVRIALRRLGEAEAAFREDYQRLLAFEALPIEVLNSARLLVAARSSLVEAFIGDNEAQFRLFVAMGQPPFGATDALREQLPMHNALEADPVPQNPPPQP